MISTGTIKRAAARRKINPFIIGLVIGYKLLNTNEAVNVQTSSRMATKANTFPEIRIKNNLFVYHEN